MGRDKSMLESCREKARPQVQACVRGREQAIAATKSAPAAPKADNAAAPADIGQVPTAFVAPPRTIADITAILDQEKPDEVKIDRAKAAADALPPQGAGASELAKFYYTRGAARSFLSRSKDALADGLKALEVGKGAIEFKQISRIRQFVAMQHQAAGDPKQAMAVFQSIVNEGNGPGTRGTLINSSRNIAQTLISMGDISQADAVARRVMSLVQESRGSPHPNWRASYQIYGNSWESDADAARALILEARGQYREAEQYYVRSEAFRRASVKDLGKFEFAPPAGQVITVANRELMSIARVKAKQGRFSEAEADARRALLGALKNSGKYHPSTPPFIVGLADILVEQGRYEEAEKLMRSALEVQRTLGIGDDTPISAGILSQLGGVLTLQRKDTDALEFYAQLEKAISKWEPQRRDVLLLNGSRIAALYAAGRVDEGIAAAQALVKHYGGRAGENHFDTASARGTLAVGFARAGRDADAIREFKAAIPIMMTASRENAEDDDTTVIAARNMRLQSVVEAYVALLASAQREQGRRYRARDLHASRRHSRPLGAAGARCLECAHDCQGLGARRARAQRAGPEQADHRAARDVKQHSVAALE